LALGLGAAGCAEPAAAPGEEIWTIDPEDSGAARGLDVALHGEQLVVGGYAADPEEVDRTRGWLGLFDDDGRAQWSVSGDLLGDRQLVSGLAVDAAGRIGVTGAVRRTELDWDIWIAIYEPDGTLVHSRLVAGPAGLEDQGVGIAVDPGTGDFLAVGYVMLADGTTDAWIERMTADGAPRWEVTHDSTDGAVDVATEVAFEPVGGRFVVVGYETGPLAGADLWVAALAEDGTMDWQLRHDEAGGNDRAQAVAADGAGGVYVVGNAVVPGHTTDAWVGRVSADGQLQWRQLYDGPASLGDGANDVATNESGDVIVGGYAFSTPGKWDAWVVALDADRTELWTHRYAAPAGGDDVVAGVTAGGDTVVVVGSASTGPQTQGLWLRKLAG
jgi:hypothetical protein